MILFTSSNTLLYGLSASFLSEINLVPLLAAATLVVNNNLLASLLDSVLNASNVYRLLHFLPFLTAALSTRFGYGRPAFFARAFAADFWAGVKGVDFFLGLGLSQNGAFFTSYQTS